MTNAVVKMQKLIRGFLARRRVARKRDFITKTAITLQCAIRRAIACHRVNVKRKEHGLKKSQQKAARDLQRVFRGTKGRARYTDAKKQYYMDLAEYNAATQLQAMVRRNAAIKRVDMIRAEKLASMNKAATFMRKMWLGAKTRKRYRELMSEFSKHERRVIIIQRYGRGFLVRLRMWREAIRAEEELWAALEIQRVWRGYCGRVLWEAKYEQVWRREMAAAMVQRNARGMISRAKVSKKRRRIARSEFERARLRFRSAQRVQALARGVISRKRTRAKAERYKKACVTIQRIARGRQLRKRLWAQLTVQRAQMIQAAIKGFLVRNRRFNLIAKVICIQRCWKKWRLKPENFRRQQFLAMQERKRKATLIQKSFRKHKEDKTISKIQQSDNPEKAGTS